MRPVTSQRQPDLDPAALFTPGAYVSGLDGLRAISVLMVMIAHFGFDKIVPGGLGVTIFFFISGFLITSLLTRESVQDGRVSVPDFYMRRVLRLYPELVLMMLVASIAFSRTLPVRGIDIAAGLAYFTNYLTLFDEIHPNPHTAWPHLWSLAVEEHFYVTFPLLFALLWRRPGRLAIVLGAVCAAALAWRLWIVSHTPPFGFAQTGVTLPYTILASDCRIDSIAYGCLTSLAFHRWLPRLGAAERLALSLGALGAVMMLVSLVDRSELFRDSWRFALQGLGLAGLFTGLYFSRIGAWARREVLDRPVMLRLGVLSYGLYLWHMELRIGFSAVTGQSMDDLPLRQKLVAALAATVLSLLLAEASLRAVRPLGRLRQRFSRHPVVAAS